MKYLDVNVTRDVQNLYANYKTLLREMNTVEQTDGCIVFLDHKTQYC